VPSVEIDTIRSSGPAGEGRSEGIAATWLGRVPYREAWALQKELVTRRAEGAIGDRLLLLEHPAVLTLGRHADESHVLADAEELRGRGIEVIRVERGGEVTYHGPGQLVAYPILGLTERGLLLRPLVRALEASMVTACASFGVIAGRREGHPGAWCDPDGPEPRKIGALGIRVERGVSYHGVALNVAPNLADFDLIDPCGTPGLVSTSIAAELQRAGADGAPATDPAAVVHAAGSLARDFAARIGAPLSWESLRPMAATA
jgi:lipoyl(octanoyl) transferase